MHAQESIRYMSYYVGEGVRHVLKIKRAPKCDNVHYLDLYHANEFIQDAVLSGASFMAARFGSGEMRAFLKTIEVRLGLRRRIPEQNMDSLCINAGFFPRDQELALRFGEEMERACRQVDLLAVWNSLPMENYVNDIFVPQARQCFLGDIEPFFAENPWTRALRGKKVLVIHPFEDSIRSQYEKRRELFEAGEILPDFELYTLKAVQTIGDEQDERFQTWFDALDYMENQAMSFDFDVAIIGCGAYGFPLAARLKSRGKCAIHMGGVTQILFGIRGSRWDAKPEYRDMVNDAWCRPDISEQPESRRQIEGACYW
ncbi:MAG: hypothetical protein HFI38_09920 [Lachnospiraceae bacterium]|jgi:hypothetical protein|nr:hypothetical protein [Lachnospiraceae bacterium]